MSFKLPHQKHPTKKHQTLWHAYHMPWCLSLKLMSENLIFFDWMPWCLSLKLMAENLMFFDWIDLVFKFETNQKTSNFLT
jgi:uncharacterized cysteine cluster protein YcgN (CxxCxxCC family)